MKLSDLFALLSEGPEILGEIETVIAELRSKDDGRTKLHAVAATAAQMAASVATFLAATHVETAQPTK